MYPPPPGLEKLKQVRVNFLCTTPPPVLEKLKQDRATTNVPPPPQNDKVGFQVKVTFWFWLMYPPPSPSRIEINMNAVENNWGQQVHFTNLPAPSFSNSAGILGQHDIVVLDDVPPWKSWILSDSQLFQSFPTKVAQNDSEWPILPDSQLFQSFPTEVVQNDSEWPISPKLQLFQSFPTEVAQNDSEQPISHDSQLFQFFFHRSGSE